MCFVLATFVILQHWLRSFLIGEDTALVQLEVTGKNIAILKKRQRYEKR